MGGFSIVMIADFAVVKAIEKPQMTLKVHACCYDMRDSMLVWGMRSLLVGSCR